MQKSFIINNIEIPYLEEGGISYYPFSTVTEKLLGKEIGRNGSTIINDRFTTKNIVYDLKNNNVQPVRCLSYEDFKYFFENRRFKVNSFTDIQKESYNLLMVYFKINKQISILGKENNIDYSKYQLKLIENSCEKISNKVCNRCALSFPINSIFFHNSSLSEDSFSNTCRSCVSKRTDDLFWESIYNTEILGEDNP